MTLLATIATSDGSALHVLLINGAVKINVFDRAGWPRAELKIEGWGDLRFAVRSLRRGEPGARAGFARARGQGAGAMRNFDILLGDMSREEVATAAAYFNAIFHEICEKERDDEEVATAAAYFNAIFHEICEKERDDDKLRRMYRSLGALLCSYVVEP